MQLPYIPDDPHLATTMDFLRQWVVESGQSSSRLLVGKVTLSCTANTLATTNVAFTKPFLEGTTPLVLTALSSLGDTTAQVTVSSKSESYTGFTAQALSSTTQTLTVVYFAIGQTQ